MSKLIFGITKIVSKKQEDLANYEILKLTFDEAYTQLRKMCPGGDLHIHLYVEADSAEKVGAVMEPKEDDQS